MLPVTGAREPVRIAHALEGVLREVVETLAPLDRTPCSPGERQAAEWLPRGCGSVAGVEVALEDEPSWGTFPPTATGLGLLGASAALLSLRGRRAPGALLAAAAFAGIVDEAQNGPRDPAPAACAAVARTVNVIARAGDTATASQHAGRARPPRRPADGHDVRPDAAAPDLRARAAAARARQDPPAAVVGRARRTARTMLRRPQRPRRGSAPCARASSIGALGGSAGGRRVAQPDGPGRQRQPLRRRRARRAGRAPARAPDPRSARAARLLRRRGDAPGRHSRVRRAPPPRARPGAPRGSSTSTRSARRTS